VKVYGDDLTVLQDKAVQIKNTLAKIPGFTDLTVVRELGQPSLLIDVDRDKIARYGINVSDVEAVISAAVGGQAVTQVIQGEKLFDLVVRMQPQFRSSAHEIGNLLVGTPDGKQIPLSQLADIKQGNGASFIYRENNSRYIGVQYSIEGRDLERAVRDGQRAVDKAVTLPQGYRLNWGGEYSQFLEAKSQLILIGPLAVVLIFMILFALYGNFKFPVTIALGVIMTEPVGALIALKLTHTPFSVSSVSRIAGVIRRIGGNRSDSGFLYQQASPGRNGYSHRNAGGLAATASSDHDDSARSLSGTAPSRALNRNRLRHAETLRHRHCGRFDLPALYRILC
jgi:heavy metal efflux system protein